MCVNKTCYFHINVSSVAQYKLVSHTIRSYRFFRTIKVETCKESRNKKKGHIEGNR